jgi:integrase
MRRLVATGMRATMTDVTGFGKSARQGQQAVSVTRFRKWFVRFAEGALSGSTKPTLHSFRHQFRDATRAARLGVGSAARLGGWESGDPNQQRQVFEYGGEEELLRMLADDIAKRGVPWPRSFASVHDVDDAVN